MSDFQEDNFEQKLLGLKDTQDSIQALSIWCLKHSQQHKKIVICWLHVLKKVKVEQRLTLFYLANDVIQYSKRKNYPFVESWATALQKATPLVRDDKVKHKILRLFKIWGERNIYDETFLADLSGLLTALTKKSSNQQSAAELIQEFQPTVLFAKIRTCKNLEEDTDLKLKIVKECSIPVSDPDALQVVIKDRRNGDDLMQDIEDGIIKLEAYTKALELEIKERIDVISILEISEQFYDTQRGEAKVVCNAYRNFGNRIKTLKRKLDELLPTLSSPVPSPDINAPSPSSGSDIDIPEETKPVCYDSEKSFIGTDFMTAMNHADNQNQLLSNLSLNYGLSDTSSLLYNPNTTNNFDEYAQQHGLMNAGPIGYYKNNSHLNSESPTSPNERDCNDSFPYHSEGNPIEVISSNKSDNHSSFNASGFLQNIMAANSADAVSVSTPLPALSGKIPGLESPTDNARDIFCFMEGKSKASEDCAPIMWGDKPLTKYQSWPSPDITWTNPQETPVSPPAFEKESFSTPVEYVDTNNPMLDGNGQFLFGGEQPPAAQSQHSRQERHQHQQQHRQRHQHTVDVDHRLLNHMAGSRDASDQISTIPLPKIDVDDRVAPPCSVSNRNLISLTDSPSSSSTNDVWKTTNDSDYRSGRGGAGVGGDMPMPPSPPTGLGSVKTAPQDNIESVDMELSDDEAAESRTEDRGSNGNVATTRHHRKSSSRDEDAASSPAATQAKPSPGNGEDAPTDGSHVATDDDTQLCPPPPPNLWDMMNAGTMNSTSVSEPTQLAEADFNKMMNNFGNAPPPPPAMEATNPSGGAVPPPQPSDFAHFAMPPLHGAHTPHPLSFGDHMHFPRAPLMSIPPPPPPVTAGPDSVPGFASRPDYGPPPPPPPMTHMQRPPNFIPPLMPPQAFGGFMPNPMNSMFVNNGGNMMRLPSVPVTPVNEHAAQPQQHQPLQQQQQQQQQPQLQPQQYGPHSESPLANASGESAGEEQLQRYNSNAGDGGAGSKISSLFEFSPSKSALRSNLKEISLSDVLERSIRSQDNEQNAEKAALQLQNDSSGGIGDGGAVSAIDNDLFGAVDDISDASGDETVLKDDGVDDLYMNMDETHGDYGEAVGDSSGSGTAAQQQTDSNALLAAAVVAAVSAAAAAAADKTSVSRTLHSDFKFVQNDNFVVYESDDTADAQMGGGDFQSPLKQKTPFQAIMPRVSKPLMAPPPNIMDDDERCPWPLMPVIDLSNEGNENQDDDCGGYQQQQPQQQQQQTPQQYQYGGGHNNNNNSGSNFNNNFGMECANGSPASFLRPSPMNNDFRPRFFGGSGGGDRRFPSPMSQSMMRGGSRGAGRFGSSRGEFRPRGGTQGVGGRMPRTPGPFQRGPGNANFQNSPRMFKGPRGNRPFRRGGW